MSVETADALCAQEGQRQQGMWSDAPGTGYVFGPVPTGPFRQPPQITKYTRRLAPLLALPLAVTAQASPSTAMMSARQVSGRMPPQPAAPCNRQHRLDLRKRPGRQCPPQRLARPRMTPEHGRGTSVVEKRRIERRENVLVGRRTPRRAHWRPGGDRLQGRGVHLGAPGAQTPPPPRVILGNAKPRPEAHSFPDRERKRFDGRGSRLTPSLRTGTPIASGLAGSPPARAAAFHPVQRLNRLAIFPLDGRHLPAHCRRRTVPYGTQSI